MQKLIKPVKKNKIDAVKLFTVNGSIDENCSPPGGPSKNCPKSVNCK